MYVLDYVDPPMLEITMKETEKNHLINSELGFNSFNNATILPFKLMENGILGGGVVTSDGLYVENTSLHVGIGCSYDFKKETIVRQNDNVIFLGFFYPNWGHFLLDSLKKIWFLFSNKYYCLEGQNLKLVYTCTPEFKFSNNIIELLNVLRIDINHLQLVNNPTVFKNVIVPDDSFINDSNDCRYYTKEYMDIIARLKTCATPLKNCYKKVYFTRTKLNTNKDVGEKDIEKLFCKFGYKVYSPEKMTFIEQVSVLQNCESFATSEGSISHNALFLKENTNLVIIRKASFINVYSSPINEMNKLNVTYIDAHLSIFTNKSREYAGPFFLYINDNVKNFFRLKYSSFNKRLFQKYFKICISSGFFGNNNIDDYYYEKLNAEIANNSKLNRLMRFFYRILPKDNILLKIIKKLIDQKHEH